MIEEIFDSVSEKMSKTVESLKSDFANIRSGRANPALFQKVSVEYYGSTTFLDQLASVNIPEARTVIISPYDKSAIKAIEQALRDNSSFDFNPSNDGNVIRISIPELTTERRKEYVKIAKQKTEEAKISLRSIRRKAKDDLDALKSELGDDAISRAEKELESKTKTFVDQTDILLKNKETDLLEK